MPGWGKGAELLREVTGQQGSWMSLGKNLLGLTAGFKEGSALSSLWLSWIPDLGIKEGSDQNVGVPCMYMACVGVCVCICLSVRPQMLWFTALSGGHQSRRLVLWT